MNIKPYSATLLAGGGLILTGLGFYFVFLRPALLPEDPRYMATSLAAIQASLPGLAPWLQKVFWVTGGYMVSTGLLTLYVALTTFRARARGAVGTVALTGLTSIGWMAAVNFALDSDFKWALLAVALLWVTALILYWIER